MCLRERDSEKKVGNRSLPVLKWSLSCPQVCETNLFHCLSFLYTLELRCGSQRNRESGKQETETWTEKDCPRLSNCELVSFLRWIHQVRKETRRWRVDDSEWGKRKGRWGKKEEKWFTCFVKRGRRSLSLTWSPERLSSTNDGLTGCKRWFEWFLEFNVTKIFRSKLCSQTALMVWTATWQRQSLLNCPTVYITSPQQCLVSGEILNDKMLVDTNTNMACFSTRIRGVNSWLTNKNVQM